MGTKFLYETGGIFFGKLKGFAPEMAAFGKVFAVAGFFVLPDALGCGKGRTASRGHGYRHGCRYD